MRAPGYTLAEVLVAVAILAIVSAAALPLASPLGEYKLDAAAEEAANALRFARAESMRTGMDYGVDFGIDPLSGERHIRVFRSDGAAPPAAVYDVYHPLDKKLYDIRLNAAPTTTGVAIGAAAFRYFSAPSTYLAYDWVAFDANGNPVYYPNPGAYAFVLDASAPAQVALTLDAARSRKVQVDTNGRVTVQ